MNTRAKIGIKAGLIVALAMLVFTWGTLAETWTPFQFLGNELYRYKIKWGEDEQESAIYSLTVKENESGNYTVNYSTQVEVEPSQLNSEVIFGVWGSYGPSLHFMFLNPMYEMLFNQLELNVGEKMSYYGQGTMKVTGTEKIVGRQGYVCRLFDTDDNPIAEWVVDPGLALPLRSTMYESSGTEGEIILLNYEKL